MKYASLKYSLKVWLTCVAVAPLIFILFLTLQNASPSDFGETTWSVENYMTFIVFETCFSLPTWGIFWFLVIAAKRCFKNIYQTKFALFLGGIFLTVATFFVFMGPADFFASPADMFYLMWANGLCIGAGVWFYRLERTEVEREVELE
jgi:hypothetical protein